MIDISRKMLSQNTVVLFAVGNWSGDVMIPGSGRPDGYRHYRGTVRVGGDHQPGRPILCYHTFGVQCGEITTIVFNLPDQAGIATQREPHPMSEQPGKLTGGI